MLEIVEKERSEGRLFILVLDPNFTARLRLALRRAFEVQEVIIEE